MRWPIVIASTWSWVTYTTVAASRRWSSTSSARVCTRSLASRFESGSSMRNACGPAHDRPRERDPLALAARELRGLAVEQLVEAEALGRVARRAASRSAAGTLRDRSGNSMFRRTVMCG